MKDFYRKLEHKGLRCEKCDAVHESDNRIRPYKVPQGEMWGLCPAGEWCSLCDMCAQDAGLRE